MPELHQLTPILSILQHQGYKVALLTDGRMSGASGKVPAAIHITPEAMDEGNIGKVRSGDTIELDPLHYSLNIIVEENELKSRKLEVPKRKNYGNGVELFQHMRNIISPSEEGASILNLHD